MSSASSQSPEAKLLELSEFLVRSLLPQDADLQLKIAERRGVTQVIIQTPEQYRGAIIGKSGVIAKSLRQILSAAKLGDSLYKVDVEIAD